MEIDETPILQYEESTGFLVLSDGITRQILCRPDPKNLTLWFWCKRRKQEVPLTLAQIFGEMQKAVKR